MKKFIIAIMLLVSSLSYAQKDEYIEHKNISYTQSSDAYAKERCKLDIKIPKCAKNFVTLVYFHGGGISAGNKHYPFSIYANTSKPPTYALVTVAYRLSPKIKAHQALEDAAEAVAWVFNNIEKYGGDKTKIFVSGHSAGGYLSGMVAFAPKYLAKHGIKNTDLAGSILLSGQVTKHFRVRNDLGDTDPQYLPKIDELSILGNASNKVSPVCLILGDRRIEFAERVEENELLYSVVRKLNSGYIEFFELQGLTHGSVAYGYAPITEAFMDRVLAKDFTFPDIKKKAKKAKVKKENATK